MLGELLIAPAILFGPLCSFTPAGALRVQTKALYELIAVATDEAGRQREVRSSSWLLMNDCWWMIDYELLLMNDCSWMIAHEWLRVAVATDGAGR
jgi:hypothetical protein